MLVVRGDLALAVPAAEKLVAALAAEWGVEPVRVRRPGELDGLAGDLRTYSMFAPGKLVVATATGALADRDAAAELMKEVEPVSVGSGAELEGGAKESALRLLQVIRLHDLDPAGASPETVLAALPDAVFGGKKAGAAEKARAELAPLLAAAVEAGLTGVGTGEASILADLVRDGLPERHLLLLVESAVAGQHPLVAALERRDAIVDAGRLEVEKGGHVAGLDRLFAELGRETGVAIAAEAARELARRTLRPEDARRGGDPTAIDADSVARLSGEFRKLASLTGGKSIGIELVEENVDDRGREDGFKIPNALADGDAAAALGEIARRVRGADDPIAERLLLFGQIAKFARDLVAVHGLIAASGVEAGVTSYPRFKERIAPALKGKLEGVASNPFSRTHEFPLQRLYLAAGRRDGARLARLPALLLETERRIKGDADDPDAALALLAVEIARCERAPASAASAGRRLR